MNWNRLLPANWNDTLSLLLMIVIPVLWASNRWLQFPEAVIGATISGWTMIVVFYFRKSPPKKGE